MKPVDIVPNVWLEEKEGQIFCWWPVKWKNEQVQEAVKNSTPPGKERNTWKDYLVELKYKNATFEKCSRKTQKYLDDGTTTGMETDGNADETPKKKKNYTQVESNRPPFFFSKRKIGTETSPISVKKKTEDQYRAGNIALISDSEACFSGNVQGCSVQNPPANCNCNKAALKQNGKFQKKVLQHLNKLHREIKSINDRLDILETSKPVESGDQIVPHLQFPINTPDDLKKVEQHLKDDSIFKKFVSYLSLRIGGNSASEVADKLMSSVFTHNCGYFLVWDGQRCSEPEFITKDSKKIGMKKAFPLLVKALGEVFLSAASRKTREGNKEVFSDTNIKRASMRWLVVSKTRLAAQHLPLPELPWKWGNETVTADTAE